MSFCFPSFLFYFRFLFPLSWCLGPLSCPLFVLRSVLGFAHFRVCLFGCVFGWLSSRLCLFGCLVVWLCACLFVCLFRCLVVWLCVCLFACLCVIHVFLFYLHYSCYLFYQLTKIKNKSWNEKFKEAEVKTKKK